MTRTDYLAFKQDYPKKPILKWVVKVGSQTLYENKEVSLCWYFINTHALKTTPKACY